MKLEDNVFNDLLASARGAPCGAAAGKQLGRGLPTGGLRRAAGASARWPRLRGDRWPSLAGLVKGAVYQRNSKCYYKFRVPKRDPSTGNTSPTTRQVMASRRGGRTKHPQRDKEKR